MLLNLFPLKDGLDLSVIHGGQTDVAADYDD